MDKEETQVIKIAAGVALGIAIASGIGYAVDRWQRQQAIAQFTQEMKQLADQSARETEEITRRIATAKAEQEAKAESEKRAAAIAQRAREEATQTRATEGTKREDAWASFYKRPKRCESPADNAALMQCANEHIRAKREFEKKYAEGKL